MRSLVSTESPLHAEGQLTPAQSALCAPTMPAEELYDLDADPHEIINLAAVPEQRATLERLRAVLENGSPTPLNRARSSSPKPW